MPASRPNVWTCARCGVRVDGLLDTFDEPRPPWGWEQLPGPDARLATCPPCRRAHDPDPPDVGDLGSWFD